MYRSWIRCSSDELRFPYQAVRVGHPVVPLQGKWLRPRPIVAVTLIGPLRTRARDALLDTAADDTVFSEALATFLGVDLTSAPQGVASGVGSHGVRGKYAQLPFRLSDGHEFRERPAWVGFTAVSMPYPVLGFAGCLQFFSAHFFGDREEVELTINSLYTGT